MFVATEGKMSVMFGEMLQISGFSLSATQTLLKAKLKNHPMN